MMPVAMQTSSVWLAASKPPPEACSVERTGPATNDPAGLVRQKHEGKKLGMPGLQA